MSSEIGSQRASPKAFPAASPLTLLAFLALTARFHDKLVAHHSPPSASRPSNPLIACQYYAAACKARLVGNSGDALGIPDGERIQALAMLALHDWGNCAGQKAWVAVGVAIRYAQILGLQYQLDLDDEPQSRSIALAGKSPLEGTGSTFDLTKSFVEDETKRRMFWGLFILDRYQSSGKFRPQMIKVDDIRIQLPCSERSFMFKERVRTNLLTGSLVDMDTRQDLHHQYTASPQRNSNGVGKPSTSTSNAKAEEDERLGRWEIGTEEGVISRYIRAIDLYGKIIRWSCSGGRRYGCMTPWFRHD